MIMNVGEAECQKYGIFHYNSKWKRIIIWYFHVHDNPNPKGEPVQVVIFKQSIWIIIEGDEEKCRDGIADEGQVG